MARLTALVLVLTGLAISGAGCATPQELHFSDGPVVDEMRPIEPVPFQVAWARPNAEFSRYTALLPAFAGITYRRPPRDVFTLVQRTYNHPLPEGLEAVLMTGLRAAFDESIERSEGWQRATAPGPSVLRAHVSVVDLVLRVPLRHPGDALSWVASVGAFTVVIDLYDSESGVIVARAAERRTIRSERWEGMRANAGDTTFHSLRIFRDWAQKLDRLLNELRDADPGSLSAPTVSS